jgi:hypothetical protein
VRSWRPTAIAGEEWQTLRHPRRRAAGASAVPYCRCRSRWSLCRRGCSNSTFRHKPKQMYPHSLEIAAQNTARPYLNARALFRKSYWGLTIVLAAPSRPAPIASAQHCESISHDPFPRMPSDRDAANRTLRPRAPSRRAWPPPPQLPAAVTPRRCPYIRRRLPAQASKRFRSRSKP